MDDKKRIIGDTVSWHISLLHKWEENEEARILYNADWLRLLTSVKKYGVKNKSEIGEDGTIYDGNHRYDARIELIKQGVTVSDNGKDLEWVEVNVSNPQSEVEKLSLAAHGNDEQFAVWRKDYVANKEDIFKQIPDYEDLSYTFDEPETYKDLYESFVIDETDNSQVKQKKEIECPSCKTKFVPD